MNKLGERIFALRTGRGMSQGDLAAALDVSRQAVSKWENGMGTPTPENIVAMSELFGVSTDHILLGKQSPAETEKAEKAPREQEGFGKRKLAQIIGIMLVALGVIISLIAFIGAFYAELLVFSLYMIAAGLFCILTSDDLRTKLFVFTILYIMAIVLIVALSEVFYTL
jgi:transcriptional regulator with XRE-family HTH domain